MINPTNCSPFSVDSQGIGDQGTVADFSSYFHAVNCGRLGVQAEDDDAAARRAQGDEAQPQPGAPDRPPDPPGRRQHQVAGGHALEAPSRSTSATSATSARDRAGGDQCAGRQPIGNASTETPLLDQPLRAPSTRSPAPAACRALAFILDGQVDAGPACRNQHRCQGRACRPSVPVIPDAPIGHFRLTVFGGKRGYLVNTRDLCVHRPVTQVSYVAQNGRRLTQRLKVKAPCGGKAGQSKKSPRRSRR